MYYFMCSHIYIKRYYFQCNSILSAEEQAANKQLRVIFSKNRSPEKHISDHKSQ